MTTLIDRTGNRTYVPNAEYAATQFPKDTADHQLTIAHDDGLYRHLKMRGESFMYWYDLITWPGALTIRGDMGTWTFAREDDMFTFFRTRPGRAINPSYWAEKIQHSTTAGARTGAEEFSLERFRTSAREHADWQLEDWPDTAAKAARAALEEQLLTREYEDAREAIEAAYDFTYHHAPVAPGDFEGTLSFEDPYEWSMTEYDTHFLWCCHAIIQGIAAYDAAKATAGDDLEVVPAREVAGV